MQNRTDSDFLPPLVSDVIADSKHYIDARIQLASATGSSAWKNT